MFLKGKLKIQIVKSTFIKSELQYANIVARSGIEPLLHG
jgi:hypothetical protein